MNRPDVFDYLDHQNFLKDWLGYLKEQKKLGPKALASSSGVSVASLSLCLSGDRNWTQNLLGKVIPHLELKKVEQQALRILFTIGTSEDPIERLAAFDELRRLPPYAEKKRDSSKVYLYLRHWLNIAVRELAHLKDFEANSRWIRDHLRFKPSELEIERSLKFLIKEGYLQQNAGGQWLVTNQQLDCQEGVYKLSLGEFHRQALELAQRSIEEVPRELRLILGHTTLLSGEQKEKAELILKEALKSIQELSHSQDNKELLYHFELVMIPLSQKKEAA